MKLKVFREEFSRKESGINFLQQLTDSDVSSDHIKITETDRHHANYSHTIVIYYWHTEQIIPVKSS